MHSPSAKPVGDGSDGRAPSEAWLFGQAILGKPIAQIVSPQAKARAEREELIRLARHSSFHAEALRRLDAAAAAARHDRQVLEWAAKISINCERKLRTLERQEVAEAEAWRRAEAMVEQLREGSWDASKHPRGGFSQNLGWFSQSSGGAGASDSAMHSSGLELLAAAAGPGRGAATGRALAAPAKSGGPELFRPYLPSEQKGKWLGAKGESKFRLNKPFTIDGKLVREIDYRSGAPVLDEWARSGISPTIVLTGDRKTDVRSAKEAWEKLNPGKKFPKNSTFHHNLLNADVQIRTINGKKVEVLVGEMQLVPKKINKAFTHQGTASIAKLHYQRTGADLKAIKQLSRSEAAFAGTGKGLVERVAKNLKRGKVAKKLLPFIGRNVVRLIPLVGTGLAVLEFAENVEAHGVGGAVVRATPLLGDLVSAHDLGTDIAKQIVYDANAKSAAHMAKVNESSRKAWEQAREQTLDAFHELAMDIEVTNTPEYGTGQLVDPKEIAEALDAYQSRMQAANHLRIVEGSGYDFAATAAQNKVELRQRLQRASQRRAPVKNDRLM